MKKQGVLLLSILFSLFLSCEIGLGSAVDTQVPEISIDTPEVGTIIRDSFSFRGTWSDDGSIKEIKLTLKTLENDGSGSVIYSKSCTIVNNSDSHNTWVCTINPIEESIKDGTYEATVKITDEADHSTIAIRQITLDNTAPVVVLQRPSTEKGAAVKDSYGQSFTIEGQAADDSNISHIDVKIYSGETLLDTVRLNNVPPTISLDVAKFLDEHYTKIYGSTEKEGTKEFWCEIEAYDGAQRYPADGSNQSAADTEGNCEREYYLYDEIKTSVLSEHKITELYKMKSGTYSTTTGERSAADEQSAVEELLKGKGKTGGSFTLNPDNSPSFRINGRDALKEGVNNFSDTTNNLTNGGELICEVSPGLDGIPLVADSLKLYAIECDEYGRIKEGAEKIYPEEYQAKEKSSSNYKFFNVFNRSAGFVFEKTYVLGFEGKDESGNSVAANGYAYGFKFATSGASPVIRISEPDEDADIYVKKGGKLKVKGSVETESGIADLTLSVNGTAFSVKDEDVSEGSVNCRLYKSLTDGGESEFEYEIDFDSEANKAIFSQSVSKKYILKVTASQGKPSEASIGFTYDVDGPAVRGYSASPVVSGNKLNGSPVFSGEFRDEKSGVKSVKYRVEKKEGGNWVTAQDEAELSSPEDFSFTVDTRAINDSESSTTDIRIVFEAEDNAGNKSETVYEYKVDQASDRPKIESSSGSFDETVSSYEILRSIITNKERRNLYTKGSTLAVKVSDDDGLMNKSGSGESSVSGVTVTLTANSSNDAATFTEGEVKTDALEINGNPESTTLTYTLPEVSGSYKVEIKAKDKAGVVPTWENSKTFYIQITGAAPDARVSAAPDYITTNTADLDENLKRTAFEVKVEITDGTGPFTVNRGSTSLEVRTTAQDPSLEYPTATETFIPGAGEVTNGRGSVTYTVTDNYGNTKNVIFDYKVDNTAPEAEIDDTSWPTKEDTEKSSYTFRGSSSDKGSIQAGIAKTEISFDGGTAVKTASGNWSYNAVFEEEGLSEGENELWVRAVDNAGNTGSWTKKSFMYDKAKPKLESIKYKRGSVDADYAEVDGSGVFESGSVFSLKIKATDTNGIKHIAVYEKEGEGEESLAGEYTAAAAHETEKEWELTGLPKTRDTDGLALKTGSYKYRIVTYDVSGATDGESKSAEKNITVNIDLAGPAVEITSPDPEEAGIISEETYLFGGTVQDGGGDAAVGVAKVYYAIKESEGEPAEGEWKELAKESSGTTKVNWKTDAYTLKEGKVLTAAEISDGKVLSEGHYWLYVKAEDKAGNESAVKSAEFYADKAKPVLSWISEPETNYTEETGSAVVIAVKAEDTNGIESISLKKNENGTEETGVTVESLIASTDENYGKIKDTKKKLAKSYTELSDGEYTFVIETKDKAERSAKLEKNITVDTKKPEIKRVKAGSVVLEENKWYKSKTLTVEITARDEAKNGYASGISTAEFSTDGGATWGAFTKGSDVTEGGIAYNTYRGPVEFASLGENTIKIRVCDKGGNTSWYGSEAGITIYIDETPASLERSKYEIGGYESAEDTIYINGEKDLTVYGTYSDGESGVGELVLSYQDGSAIAADISYAKAENGVISGEYEAYSTYGTLEDRKQIGFWKAEIGTAALAALKDKSDGKSRLTVKGVNGAGSETTLNAYSLVWDKTSPNISGITLKYSESEDEKAETSVYKDTEGKYFINPEGKWITVSGNAGDSNGLAKIYYSTDGKAVTQSGKSWSELVIGANGKSEAGYTRESWGFVKIQLSGDDGEVKNIDIKAEDKAGNTATARESVQIDKSAPLALHLLDEKGKDLYFRVGSNDNDDNENETTGEAAFGDDDRDVGGKYTGGTFGNASTIVIRGSFIDVKDGEKADVENGTKGSGVKNIYYKVYGTEGTIPEGQNLIDEVKAYGQYVTLKKETKRVFFTGPAGGVLKKYNVENRGSEVTGQSGAYVEKSGTFYRDTKYYTDITTTYKDSVAGFNEGNNYLVLVAEDNAGNCAADKIRNVPVKTTTGGVTTTTYETCKDYSLNVDTEVPSITSGTTETVYTNCAGDLEIELTATDTAKEADIEPAGIRSVVIEVGSRKIKEGETANPAGKIEYVKKTTSQTGTVITETVTDKPDDTEDTYEGKTRKTAYRKVTLKPEAFEGLSGNITVYATVSDNAGTGNSQRVSAATVNVDETAPVVTLEEPKDADEDTDGIQVNKIIELKGNASDNASGTYRLLGLCYTASAVSHAKPAMEKRSRTYTWAAPEGWAIISAAQKSGSTAASWTFENIDTEKLDGTNATSGSVWVSCAVQDNAGNIGYSEPLELYIDQETDRPKITFTGIDNLNTMTAEESGRVWIKYTNILNGKVEDDDGIKAAATGKEFWYNTGSEWIQITIGNGGSWKVTLDDGSYSIKFKVTDAKGTVFETGTAALPRLYDNAGHTKDIALNLGVDKTSPVYTDLNYSYYDSAASTPGYTDWSSDQPVTGGNRTKLRLQLRAGDENKIESVKISVTYKKNKVDYSDEYEGSPETAENTAPGSGDEGKYYRIWKINNIDVSKTHLGETDQSLTISLKIKDKAGLEKEDTLRVRADNKAPEIGFTGPSSSTTSCGEIVVLGNANGEPVSMQYAVSADGTNSPDAAENVTVWSGEGITDRAVLSGGNAKTEYKNVNGFGNSWQVTFDGKPNTTAASHEKMFTDLLKDFRITTAEALSATQDAFDDIVYLYVWIKSSDEVGNECESCHQIKLDPQGDRPTADFSYPAADGVKMGGKVKIYGTAMDTLGTNIGVDSVWLQIKAGSESVGTITKADLDFMAENGYDVYNMHTYTAGGTNPKWGTGITDKEPDYDYPDYAALASSTGAAWNIEINRNLNSTTHKRELDPSGSASIKISALRIYARDKDGKLSVSADRNVIFDADKPVISELSLVQRDGSGNLKASRAYSSDMYIKGEWNLEGTVTDKDNIGSLAITINDVEHKLIENGSVLDSVHATRTEGTEATDGNPSTDGSATFSYPVGSGTGVGKLSITVNAVDMVTDGTPNPQSENLVIYYDNTAPEVQNVLTTGKSADAAAITVSQSNSWYTFGSEASEPAVGDVAQSGYAYTVFYFKRSYTIGSTATTKLYDVLKARVNGTNNDAAATDISTEAKLAAAGLEYSNPSSGGDGLYWYTKSAERNASALNVLTVSDAESTIRDNSLVKIGGAYYKVTDVSGSSVTIDGYPAAEFEEVKVAFGTVVDNTVPEGDGTTFGSDGYYTAPSRDDGDRMIESVIKSGSTWTWEANICSKNIPDGPVELIYTVFDAAGNTTVKNISGTVDNNSPRLAGVTIKTDYDGDGKFNGTGEVISTWASPSDFDDDEYYTGTKTVGGNTVRVYDPTKNSVKLNRKNLLGTSITQGSVSSPVAVLKGRTQVVPEVVGGNGAIYYSYDIGSGMSGMNSTTPLIADGSIDYTSKEGTIDIQVGDLLTAGDTASESTARKFSFELYDSTDGSYWTAGNASRANAKIASIYLYFAVRVADASEPVVTINPFYWNGLNDNSVYDSENAEKYAQLKGHIELPQDLDTTTVFTASSGLMDEDPKVSGKIVMKGSVTDAKRLKEIKASIFGTYADDTAVTLAAAGSNGLLAETAAASDFDTNGYSFVIDTQTLGSAGHTLTWTLSLDTEKVGQLGSDHLGLDKAVTIKAFNYGVPEAPSGSVYTSINGTTTYGATKWNNKSHEKNLQMDIVPYVTEVTTSLSVHDTNNPSVYARTALGHYPVYATHAQGDGGYTYEPDIKLKGFNLAGCTVDFEDGVTSDTLQEKNAAGTEVKYNREAGLTAGDGVYTFTLPNGARTGKVSVYKNVGGTKITSLNNLNSNDAHGVDPAVAGSGYTYTGTIPPQGNQAKYSNFYNRIPNGINNNILTDDLVFDVWELNSEAARAYADGKADNAVMKINPVSGMIGFAFSNGSERFSMGGTLTADAETNPDTNNEYSYRQWNMTFDYMNYNYFAYDSSGHSYGTTSGGDISADDSNPRWDFFSFMSDRWGRLDEKSGANKRNAGGKYYGNQWDANIHNLLIRPEGTGQSGSASNPTAGRSNNSRIRKDRIQSTSIATLRHDDSATYIYLAYYDLINKEIRFRTCNLLDTETSVSTDANTQISRYGSLIDVCTKKNNGWTTYADTADTCQIMATNTTDSKDGNYDQSKTFGSAGNAVALGVTSSNVVVMVWNDGNNNLKIAYNTTPQTLHQGATRDGWEGYTTLISGAGEYCQLVVDGDDNIHVVAYNNSGLDLKYAFVPKMVDDNSKNVPNISAAKTCDVDTYDNVGSRLSLDVAKEGDNYIPHIGYWGAYPAAPRYAYLADPATFYGTNGNSDDAIKARSGAVSDMYTGVWECGVVPTNMGVKQGKVNVGVWKYDVDENNKGKRVASNYSEFTVSNNKKSTDSSAENDKGFCYGNATDNAVLAYVVMPSSTTYHIETAQMR